MKKFAFIMAVVFITVSSFGQTKTTTDKITQKQQVKTEQTKLTDKTGKTADTTKLKKDGTPDKRFKANKTEQKTTGPLKKDGTADMRYKDNKTGTSTKK